jgi:hypothetical protein
MLKRLIPACLFIGITALSAHAAEEAKNTSPPATAKGAKPNEAVGTITVPAPTIQKAPKKKSKWSNPNLDLTHCLERDSNTAIIKCAE